MTRAEDRGVRDRLDQVAGAPMLRARPWDVIGAAVGAPMVLWGLLGWFGTVGDTGRGIPGFFSAPGAVGIGLVLAASALTLGQIFEGRAHRATGPPVAVLLAGAAAILILGGMIAKPESTTIQSGSVTGLVTAIGQTTALLVGWVKGSGKSVRSANMRAYLAQQAAADEAAVRPPAVVTYPVPDTRSQPPPAGHPSSGYPSSGYPPSGYPPSGHPPSGYLPPGSYPPPNLGYPAAPR